ncbi:hypothetical protein KTH46_15320 [Acinetobacter bereziniae]|uniref:hypothetical protein n=1 Tax=Acinetobacter bereziniae TaxID=106648 RepID=UPI0021CE45E5|nr:hypothetical protein [Acinetobacter bereziniae]MCU4316383.1 hypothetical protein [Acinetobacter bereziniae]
MSFEQLQQFNNLDIIGGQNNLAGMIWLHTLSESFHQISLKSSKPFQIKGEVFTPTAALIEFDHGIKMTQQIVQNHCALPISIFANELNVSPKASFILAKMNQIIVQQSWFDILQINQHPSKHQILEGLQTIWNEIRGYSASTEAESDTNKRKKLTSDQAKENSKVVSRLLTQHKDLSLTRLSYFLCPKGETGTLKANELEKAIVKLKCKLIDELQWLNQGNLYCIQWRIQRSLYGLYYLNMLIYHDHQHPLVQLKSVDQGFLSHVFDKEGQISVQLNLSNICIQTLKLERDNFQGINLAAWKVIFNNMLYPLKYYYYQSKFIKPNFEYIVY